MFRNVCVLALVVVCGQAANAFSADMVMGMAKKMAGEAVAKGMTCLTNNKAADVMQKPTPEKIVHACGCLAGCAMQTVGMMEKDGKMNVALITKNIPANMPMGDKVQQIMNDCAGKGGDPCTAVFSFGKCVCTDGPMKEILDAVKSMATSLVMEIVKASM